jgi:hypothetical protein
VFCSSHVLKEVVLDDFRSALRIEKDWKVFRYEIGAKIGAVAREATRE